MPQACSMLGLRHGSQRAANALSFTRAAKYARSVRQAVVPVYHSAGTYLNANIQRNASLSCWTGLPRSCELVAIKPARSRDWCVSVSRSVATQAVAAAAVPEPVGPSSGRPLWRSVIKWSFRCVAGLLLAAAALTAFLPSILGTQRGRDACLQLATRSIPGTVTVSDVQVGWLSPINITGVAWTEPDNLGGRQLASIEQITSSATLLDIVRGQQFDVMVSGPQVDCSIDPASGEVHITQVLQGTAQPAAIVPKSTAASQDLQAVKHAKHGHYQPLEQSSLLPFTAEGQLLNGHVYVNDGILKVPDEVRQVVGRDLHASAIIGAANFDEHAADFGISADWVGQSEKPQGALDATAVVIHSEHVNAELSGWQTATGLLLRQPATASVEYTPALAKYGLQRISPLLSNVAAIQEGGNVDICLTPENLALPAEKTTVRIEPMKLVVGRGDFLSKIVNLVGLKDSSLANKSSLQAWTGAIAVDVHPEGPIETHRVDVLLGTGHGNKGIHLCMWGKVTPADNSALDMTLGLPADTLAWAGLQGVPPDGMLTIAVTGTADKPKIEWQQAYNKLTSAALTWQTQQPAADHPVSLKEAAANRALKGLKSLHNKVTGSGSGAKSGAHVAVPQPVATLPWSASSSRPE